MTSRRFPVLIIVGLVGAMVLLSACSPGTERFTSADDPAGFLWGVWHGWIAPFSLVWHVFNDSVRIYETNNTGIWYDLGFYTAIISGFGSFGLTRRRPRGKRRREG